MNGASTERELLCIKTMGVTIEANTLIDCDRGFISLRETQNCVVERNWLESGSMINVHGRGHIIRGNVSDDIVAMVNVEMLTSGIASARTRASCHRPVGTHTAEKGKPARNNTFRGNSHRIELIEGPNGHAGSTETGVGSTLQARASKLSLDDVGPNAPWPVNAD